MPKVAALLRLRSDDRLLLAQTAVLLAIFRVVLWCAPFGYARKIAAGLGRRNVRSNLDPHRVAWATEASAHGIHVSNCLTKALSAHVLLTRSGIVSRIRVGVAKGDDGRVLAHAWLTVGEEVLVGAGELRTYEMATGPGRIA